MSCREAGAHWRTGLYKAELFKRPNVIAIRRPDVAGLSGVAISCGVRRLNHRDSFDSQLHDASERREITAARCSRMT